MRVTLRYWAVDFESNILIVLALAESKAIATISSSILLTHWMPLSNHSSNPDRLTVTLSCMLLVVCSDKSHQGPSLLHGSTYSSVYEWSGSLPTRRSWVPSIRSHTPNTLIKKILDKRVRQLLSTKGTFPSGLHHAVTIGLISPKSSIWKVMLMQMNP